MGLKKKQNRLNKTSRNVSLFLLLLNKKYPNQEFRTHFSG
ncbi:hypothetical protein ADIS_2674 [Lunatimonas lonarensis]|uniref:Uncharacterized protein n=1 Tax=Lunatimonas lonarensis TaxID=1232681 RepID=R7ZRY0_9BACT|nr:hypothetical protein ADIS_2674 [Lunatimonas lonarensis]